MITSEKALRSENVALEMVDVRRWAVGWTARIAATAGSTPVPSVGSFFGASV